MAIASVEPVIDGHVSDRQQSKLVPPRVIGLPRAQAERDSRSMASTVGCNSLTAGKMEVLLVAGGSGTRLGFQQPKRTYPIGPVSDRSFFQLFAGQVLALSNRRSDQSADDLGCKRSRAGDGRVFTAKSSDVKRSDFTPSDRLPVKPGLSRERLRET